jgi:aromatic ring-cleaving dioxygenase
MTTTRTNRFPGRCSICSATVPAEAGILTGAPGRWITTHAPGACPEVVEAEAVEVVEDPAPGVYVTATGDLVRVKMGRQSRKVYGMTWANTGGNSGDWTYRGRDILSAIVRPITADEASAFGHDHDHCVFCNIRLEDDRSVAVGYGKVCAGNYGLPWGAARQSAKVTGGHTLSA